MKTLLGRKAKIISDNDNYDSFRNKTLKITHVAYSTEDNPGYDNGKSQSSRHAQMPEAYKIISIIKRRTMKTIMGCYITALPKDFLDPMPEVHISFDGFTYKKLFEYYPDEISFDAGEFIGLTEEQARQLKFNKDKEYLNGK